LPSPSLPSPPPSPLLSEVRREQAERVAAWGKGLLVAVAIALMCMLGRVVQLKLAPNVRLGPAVGSTISSRAEMTRRGDLLDRVGRVIATSTIGFKLFVDPQRIDDLGTIAVDLADIAALDPIAVDRELSKRPDSRYVVVDDLLNDAQVEAIRRADLKGVGLQPRLVRHYPHGDMAAASVGKVGFEHAGQGGFELIFDQQLQPQMGHLTYLRDVGRRALWIDPDDYQPGRDGTDMRLSIDLVIQEFCEKRLRQAIDEYNAGGGRMIVVDSNTGEILAMTDFLNERPGWSDAVSDPGRKLHPALGRNRCVSDPYEPGSTFKPFIWSVATELGKAKPDELLPTPEHTGWRTPYGRLIRDTHYYGPSTWRKVLVKSMNTGMAMIAERLSHRQMQDAIARFGFGSRTNCGLKGESSGIVTAPRQWRTYTQSSVSFGHEIAITPLQMARAFCVFARDDGTLPNLRITAYDAFEERQQIAEGRAPTMLRRVLKPEIVALTREALKGVMEEGTGRAAQSDKYSMFSKSGTAQLPRKDRKGYHQDRYVASFIAGAPYDDPRIVVLCVIDDPDRSRGHFGGAIAGPVVRDVVDQTLEYLGVKPDHQPQYQAALAKAQ
jgi:cell division protein FtsI (penicillin-binding protein 3)